LLQVDYDATKPTMRAVCRLTLYRDMAQQLAFMHQHGADQGRDIEEPALRAILRADRVPAAPRGFRSPCAATAGCSKSAMALTVPPSRPAGFLVAVT
jgi:hypothetical protein